MAPIKVAAVNAAAVFGDKKAGTAKVIKMIHDASQQGIELAVFPEAFIPGFPHFVFAYPPMAYGQALFEYMQQAVSVFEPASIEAGKPVVSADLEPILTACREARVAAVVGVTERSSVSTTTLFNSQIFISHTGELLGVHRKLVPTYCERSVWAYGGGATLRTWPITVASARTQSFKIGGLCCGENLNYGAKLALVLEGEQVHAASWPAQCAIVGMENTHAEIRMLAESHSLNAFCFTIAASCIIDEGELAWMRERLGEQACLQRGAGWSGVVAPGGAILAQEVNGLKDTFVTAEIDLASIDAEKLWNDPIGHYRRPEVLKLHVNREVVWPDDPFVADSSHVEHRTTKLLNNHNSAA